LNAISVAIDARTLVAGDLHQVRKRACGGLHVVFVSAQRAAV
jgi:hypothetical protein